MTGGACCAEKMEQHEQFSPELHWLIFFIFMCIHVLCYEKKTKNHLIAVHRGIPRLKLGSKVAKAACIPAGGVLVTGACRRAWAAGSSM